MLEKIVTCTRPHKDKNTGLWVPDQCLPTCVISLSFFKSPWRDDSLWPPIHSAPSSLLLLPPAFPLFPEDDCFSGKVWEAGRPKGAFWDQRAGAQGWNSGQMSSLAMFGHGWAPCIFHSCILFSSLFLISLHLSQILLSPYCFFLNLGWGAMALIFKILIVLVFQRKTWALIQPQQDLPRQKNHDLSQHIFFLSTKARDTPWTQKILRTLSPWEI